MMNPEETPFPEILLQFVRTFDDQVEGHARKDLSAEEKAFLIQCCDGEVSQEKRSQMLALLENNDEAIEFLAALLK